MDLPVSPTRNPENQGKKWYLWLVFALSLLISLTSIKPHMRILLRRSLSPKALPAFVILRTETHLRA